MAEFSVIMKQWRRMCNDCATTCSLFDGLCTTILGMSIQDLSDSDISEIEETVVAWAAEHPEPVYPTWGQYFRRYYGLEYCKGHEMLLENIPADIAQNLGIEPKGES